MKKTITLPDKDTALFGFRTNLSLSDQRIFLYLLKSAFEQRKGLGANKKDVLQLYITFELGQALGKETGKFCVPCKKFADKRADCIPSRYENKHPSIRIYSNSHL